VINFRYHVVSLTAVFLALAIGLIVGTAALNGPLSDELKHQVNQLSAQNQQYRGQVDLLNADVAQREQFATEVAPQLLAGKLAGKSVLVVSMQQSSNYVDAMVKDLQLAGATVTGQVEIADAFVKPSNNETLLQLASDANATLNITGLPANSNGVETATALLAAVLINHQPVVQPAARTTVLSAYEDQHMITVTGDIKTSADAVMLLATPPYTDQDAAAENQNTVTMIDQFDGPGPIVVGANGSAGQGNVIGAVTGDASLSKTVSTVDNINTPQGQIAAALALTEQIDYGKTGHYGVASSATSLLPTLPPAS
jgi:hypothetical protein